MDVIDILMAKMLSGGSGGGMSEAFKQALLDCFENVAWISDDGQTYYDALYAALYPPVDLLSISAVFTQGEAVIYDTDDLDTLKQYLVVTATMSDSTTRTVTDYTLSGTLTEGTSVITVSYGGKTATFNVTVSQPSIYTVFDFVHPTGGTNTGIVAEDVIIPTNFKIETEFYGEYSSATAAIPVMGVRGISGNTGYKYFALYYTSGNGKVGYWYLNADTAVSLTAPTDAKNTIAFEGSNGTLTITLNGTQYTDSYTDPQVSAITGFRFFGYYAPSISSTGQSRNWVGRTKIYNSSGVLLYDFVPCYQTTTGFYGFHETVNDKFYTDSSDASLYVGVNIQ